MLSQHRQQAPYDGGTRDEPRGLGDGGTLSDEAETLPQDWVLVKHVLDGQISG